jgi:hypothetical protein
MSALNGLEGALKAMVAHAIDEVLAEKLTEIETAARDAIARGIASALQGTAPSAAGAAGSTPRAVAPAKTATAARPAPRPGRAAPPRAGKTHPEWEAARNVRRAPAKKPEPKAPGQARSQTEIEELTANVLQQIVARPGLTAEGLVEALGASGTQTSTRAIRLPLQRLVVDRSIHFKGNKRFTRYYVAA